MGEDWFCDRIEVLVPNHVTSLENRPSLCPEDQILDGSRARSPFNPFSYPVWRFVATRPAFAGQTHGSFINVLRNRNAAGQFLELQ